MLLFQSTFTFRYQETFRVLALSANETFVNVVLSRFKWESDEREIS